MSQSKAALLRKTMAKRSVEAANRAVSETNARLISPDERPIKRTRLSRPSIVPSLNTTQSDDDDVYVVDKPKVKAAGLAIPDPHQAKDRVKRKQPAVNDVINSLMAPSSAPASNQSNAQPVKPNTQLHSSRIAPAHQKPNEITQQSKLPLPSAQSSTAFSISEDKVGERAFYQIVLQWDPTEELEITESPNNQIDESRPDANSRFDSAAEYQAFFRPLLLNDFRAQLNQSYEANQSSHLFNLPDLQLRSLDERDGRGAGDSMYSLDFIHCVYNPLNMSERAKIHRSLKEWSIGDLALLKFHPTVPARKQNSTTLPTSSSSSQSDMKSSHLIVIIDAIDLLYTNQSPNSAAIVRVRAFLPLQGDTSNSTVSHNRFQSMWKALQVIQPSVPPRQSATAPAKTSTKPPSKQPALSPEPESSFSLVKLDTCVTTMREFIALSNVKSLSLLQHLLSPPRDSQQAMNQPPADAMAELLGPGVDEAEVDRAYAVLPQKFRDFQSVNLNQYQFAAVKLTSMRALTSGLTLLQGPPGTGKTKTVVSLLNSLHLRSYQAHYASLIENLLHTPALKKMIAEQINGPSQSSNQSLDQIAQSLTQSFPAAVVLPKPRFLVCAPSNAGVDEIIARVLGIDNTTTIAQRLDSQVALNALSGAFIDGNLARYSPDIVRIGQTDSIREEVKAKISLDVLVDVHMKMTVEQLSARQRHALQVKQDTERDLNTSIASYHHRFLADIKSRLKFLKPAEYHTLRIRYDPGEIVEPSFLSHVAHMRERLHLATLDHQRCTIVLNHYTPAFDDPKNFVMKPRERSAAIDKLRLSHLNEAHIVFCTLSGAGLDLLSHLDLPFQALIIDEAAQATELATLVSMRHNVNHAILIGDPRQLPATVFMSHELSGRKFIERSMFERCQAAGQHVMALQTQYRMHSEIRRFPSDHFYGGRLLDGGNVTSLLYQKSYHHHPLFAPFLVFDIRPDIITSFVDQRAMKQTRTQFSSLLEQQGKSSSNFVEAAFVVRLCEMLLGMYGREVNLNNIGIISFYQQQRKLIAAMLEESTICKPSATGAIEVSTVDGFQGREKDIIIVSCVRQHRGRARSRRANTLGFVADIRRMNVALTRGRFGLWVCGDANALAQGSDSWRELMDNAQQRQLIRGSRDIARSDPAFLPFSNDPPVAMNWQPPPVTNNFILNQPQANFHHQLDQLQHQIQQIQQQNGILPHDAALPMLERM